MKIINKESEVMVIYNIHNGVKKIKSKTVLATSGIAVAIVGLAASVVMPLGAHAAGGFDQYGYNRPAHIFNGTGSSWCLAGGQAADCQGPYSSDHLVMKWNAAWDACNNTGYDNAENCTGAWVTNEWNGNVPGGSGDSEHYKIIWVGSLGEGSSYWRDGGYLVWGNYEVIMDQGVVGGQHVWYTDKLATPNGLGGGLQN